MADRAKPLKIVLLASLTRGVMIVGTAIILYLTLGASTLSAVLFALACGFMGGWFRPS